MGAAASPPSPPSRPRAARARPREVEAAELGVAFKRLFRTLNRLRGRDTRLTGTTLSQAQFELLIELEERGELPTGELAGAARLAPGSVTQMLEHLETAGHVQRVRSASDRRVVVTRLTKQGARALAGKRERWQARWQGALADVPAAELIAARRVLERLEAMFDEPDEQDPTRPRGRSGSARATGADGHSGRARNARGNGR